MQPLVLHPTLRLLGAKPMHVHPILALLEPSTLGDSPAQQATSGVTKTAIANSVELYGGQGLSDIGSADIAQLSAEAQTYFNSQTTTQANDARIAQGTAAAASLVQNGYHPDSDADNQELIHAIAGGASIIPVVGPTLGAAIEAINFIGREVWAPLINKIAGYAPGPYCVSSGDWTVAQVLANMGASTPPPTGTLAALAVPAFAAAYVSFATCADFNNAKGAIPYGYAATLAPVLKIWNQAATGTLVDYFVPRINATDWPGSTTAPPFYPMPSQTGRNCINAAPFCYPEQGPYAFLPLSQVPEFDAQSRPIAAAANENNTWIRIAANAGPVARVVHLQMAQPIKKSSPSPASSSSTSAGAVVAGVAVTAVAAGGVAAALGYSPIAWIARLLRP